MLMFNNLCIVYDVICVYVYVIILVLLFKFFYLWLCVENGMSGVFSLMVWVIFVFCVFNKRYNQMEGVVVGMFGFYILIQDNLMILILE